MEEFGTPFYLKLDIEGGEIYCLRDLIVSDPPGYVSFEKTAQASVESLTLLRDMGYTGFKLICQKSFLPVEYPATPQQKRSARAQNLLKSKNPLVNLFCEAGGGGWLQRRFAPARYQPGWTFRPGCSGLFGEDTPGKWQTFEEIVETLAKANASFAAREPSVFWGDEGFSFWADFHAKRKS
jgi:hypothetical protein